MKRRIIALVPSYLGGLLGGAAILLVLSYALPVREFGSGLGTFFIWLEVLTPFFSGVFVLFIAPFLLWQSALPHELSRRLKIASVVLVFVLVELTTMALWRAWDYWSFAIEFLFCAAASSMGSVVVYTHFAGSPKKERSH